MEISNSDPGIVSLLTPVSESIYIDYLDPCPEVNLYRLPWPLSLKSIFIDFLTNSRSQHVTLSWCHCTEAACHTVTGRVSHCHVCHVQYGSLHIRPLKNLVILDSLNHLSTLCISSNSILNTKFVLINFRHACLRELVPDQTMYNLSYFGPHA